MMDKTTSVEGINVGTKPLPLEWEFQAEKGNRTQEAVDNDSQCEGHHGGSYYPGLAAFSDDEWDRQSGDDNQFRPDSPWGGEDQRSKTDDRIEQIYKDLSNKIFDTERPMNSGYLYDRSYYAGFGKWHAGIDLDAPAGTNVKAVVGGNVAWISNPGTNDSFIGINSDDGRQWVYGHVGSLNFNVGHRVNAGDNLAKIGYQNHLHLEVENGHAYGGTNGAHTNQTHVKNVTLSPLQAYWELQNANSNHEDCDTGSGGTSSSLIASENINPGTVLETMNITWGSKNLTVGAFDAGKNMNAVLAAIRAHESNGRYGSFGGSTPGDHGAATSLGAYQESYAATNLPRGNSVMGTNYSLNQFNSGDPFAQDIAAIGRIQGHGLFDLINNANLNDSQQRFNIAEGVVNAWGSWFSDRDTINSTPQQKYNYKLSHSQAILEALEWA